MRRFKSYGYREPEIKAEAPPWDKPSEPLKQWGEPADSISALKSMIERVAEMFRDHVPESESEIIGVRQDTGNLKVHIRGGVRKHSDCDAWVTKKTLPLIMNILYSMKHHKEKLEAILSPEEARNLYHDAINAFRYVHEPEKPDIEGYLVNTSGDYILPGNSIPCPELLAKNLFRQTGYVFVGDESRRRNKTYVDEILARLQSVKEHQPKKKAGPGYEVGDNWHNEDYTKVLWNGEMYTFNKTQARAVEYLWRNKRAGEMSIGGYIGSENWNYRLRHTFRQNKGGQSMMHPAWGTMIVNDGKGIYALNEKKQKSPEK